MGQQLSPSQALMRRHSAAMRVIKHVDQAERIDLLIYVLRGSKKIDEAIQAAEDHRLEMLAARRAARERELVEV